MTTHLLPTRGEVPMCGAAPPVTMEADINRVTCDLCYTMHDALADEHADDDVATGYDPHHACGDDPCRHYELPGD